MSSDGCIGWIYNAFGDCIVSTRDRVSFAIGLLSTLIWIVSAVPQIVANYKAKSVEGISPFLFSLLLTGDIANLLGVFLTNALFTQILTACLYVLEDGTCFIQYLYYRCCYHPQEVAIGGTKNDEIHDEESLSPLHGGAGIAAVAVAAAALATPTATSIYIGPYTGENLTGTILGWVGALIYISSRIPQVIKNFKRHMVSELNPWYMVCTISGNSTYFLSIIIRNTADYYLWKQCPFLISSLGPMTCDIITSIQMCAFGTRPSSAQKEGSPEAADEVEEDADENGDRRLSEI